MIGFYINDVFQLFFILEYIRLPNLHVFTLYLGANLNFDTLFFLFTSICKYMKVANNFTSVTLANGFYLSHVINTHMHIIKPQ